MSIERRTWWIGRLLALLLILISLRTAYWQLWRGLSLNPVALNPVQAARYYAELRGAPTPDPRAPEAASLSQLPQPVVQRTVQMLSTIERGKITDRDGNVLVEDQGIPGEFVRVYYDPSLAHMIGYASALRTGIMGLEATYNKELLGLDRADTEISRMLHRPIKGSSLELTIDSDIQRAAAQAVGGQAGAVVALDGKTGAVLAMVSTPGFDPNQVTNTEYAASLPNTALINRVTQGLYTPGSTFKLVTMIAGLESGTITPRTVFDFGEPKTDPNSGKVYYTLEVNGGLIYDFNHRENRLDLERSLVTSANVAFAKIALDMNPDTYISQAAKLGFDAPDYTRRFPLELPVGLPQLANNVDDIRANDLLRAHTGYGQGELLTTPLNMAMVVEAIANDGNIPVPYMVQNIRDPEGRVVRRQPNQHLVRGVMRADNAAIVKDAMVALVNAYFGENWAGEGVVAGGKTGTAELGGDLNPHAWFVGFAEKGDRQVVIAVMMENAGSGGQIAARIFQQVAAAAMADQPAP